MYNIRLKSVPNKAKTGSQLDYSLVDRNTLFLKPNTPVDSDVKNTMGAVSRDKANIEAEGGETVVGDINNDGYLEHQTIVGKRHTQGGVPLNVPEGSFIFSDTKKMKIKDPEVLAIFGMKPSKDGYTPAEIAKKYNINDYIAILKDPAKDKYSKETAEIMLESNVKKLGMLALIQESMKGFPDGVPAIAESVIGQMQGQSAEEAQESPEEQSAEGPQREMTEGEQPQQRFGGQLTKAQFGKNNDLNPNTTTTYFPTKQETQKAIQEQKLKNEKAKKLQKVSKSKDGYTGYWDRVGHEGLRVLGIGTPGKDTWARPNDPRMYEAMHKLNPFSEEYNGEGFIGGSLDYLGNLFSMPQKEMNHVLTGLYETPMTTAQRYGDYSPAVRWIGDVATDPFFLEGFGLSKLPLKYTGKAGKAIVKGSKYLGNQAVAGAKYVGKQIAPIVEKVVEKVEPAIQYTKEMWDKIPIEKKVLLLSKISTAATHADSNQKPVPIEDLSHKAYLQKLDELEKTKSIDTTKNLTIPTNLTPPAILTNVDTTTNDINKTVKYYNPKLPKPEDTETVKWLPAQNSAELNSTINEKAPAVIDASQKGAAVRNVAEKAQQTADEVNTQKAAAQPVEKPTYKVRIKTPPTNTQPEIPSERTVEGYKYGGDIHKYQNGSTITESQNNEAPPKKILKYIVGKLPENKGKIFAQYTDNSIGQNDITKYLKWDPNAPTKAGGKGAMRLELPQNLPFKEKQRLANYITQTGFGDVASKDPNQKILQSSSAHINPKDYYEGFYGGTSPQDFEDKLVRENFGDDATDRMSEVAKRREAFKILGIKADETEIADAKKLYNPNFINNTFYPAFTKLLPADIYRPEMLNDRRLALEHLDAYRLPKKEKAKEKEINIATVNKPYTTPNFKDTGWWLQDRLNLAGALTDRVNAYFPAMANHNYMTPGYVLNDPTTQIRAVQQGTNALINQGFNSMSGNVAMATASGINGQGIDKAAEVAGNVGNSNVGIVNNASARNAEIMNREVDQKENDKQVYMGNVSRTLENLDKANSFKKWRTIGALNNGITNMQRKNQYEDQIDPNTFIDPITGHVSKHGYDTVQLDDNGHFIYQPHQSYMAGVGNTIDPVELYKDYRKQNYNHQEAHDLAALQLRAHSMRMGRSGQPYNTYSGGYGNSQYPGGYGATAASAYGYDDYSQY